MSHTIPSHQIHPVPWGLPGGGAETAAGTAAEPAAMAFFSWPQSKLSACHKPSKWVEVFFFRCGIYGFQNLEEALQAFVILSQW